MTLNNIRIITHNIKDKIKKNHNIFLLISLISVTIFSIMVPVAWGLDEQVHLARAYQISESHLYPEKLTGNHTYGGYIPENLAKAVEFGWKESNATNRDKPFYFTGRKDIRDKELLDKIENAPLNNGKFTKYSFGPTGPYSPVVYLPSAIGMKIGSIFNATVRQAVFLARIFQAIFYITCVYIALKLLSKKKIAWVLFLIALLPSSIYQSITVNADSYTNGVLILFLAMVLNSFLAEKVLSKRHIVGLAIITTLLMLAKPSYVIAAALLLFIPTDKFPWKNYIWRIKIAICLFAGMIFLVTTLRAMQYSDAGMMYLTSEQAAHLSLKGQLLYVVQNPLRFAMVLGRAILENTPDWYSSLIGNLGYNTVRIPHAMTLFITSVFTVVALYIEKLKNRLLSWAIFIAGVLMMLASIVLLYGTFNPVGSTVIAGVQGRYFVPCLPFLIIGLAGLIKPKLIMSDTFARVLFIGTPVLLLATAIIGYEASLI